MARTNSAAASFCDSAADVARRFGIKIKTLRMCEAAGLIKSVRDAGGRRT